MTSLPKPAVPPPPSGDRFAAVRAALRQDSPLWQVQHIDITCDGCEAEPIVGHRFKCTVCEDIDLCSACMRALVAARLRMSQEAPPPPAPPRQAGRPRRWVHKLRSHDLAAKWAALQTAVPCLHPAHKFGKVVDGPERAVVFLAGGSSSDGGDGGGGDSGGGAAARLDQFLATFPPSAASCRDVAWIVVSHPEGDSSATTAAAAQQGEGGSTTAAAAAAVPAAGSSGAGLEERVDAVIEAWEKLTASGRRPTAADVDALAARHGILKGKWMLFARSGSEADAAWAAVARAVCGVATGGEAAAVTQQEGRLQADQQAAEQLQRMQLHAEDQAGHAQQQRPAEQQQPAEQQARPLCQSAKVSSTSPDGSWVLCAYTDNYQDRADVRRVCAALQAAVPPGLLQDRRLLYKPDIFTYLGIYSRNQWQLKPTVLEAKLR